MPHPAKATRKRRVQRTWKIALVGALALSIGIPGALTAVQHQDQLLGPATELYHAHIPAPAQQWLEGIAPWALAIGLGGTVVYLGMLAYNLANKRLRPGAPITYLGGGGRDAATLNKGIGLGDATTRHKTRMGVVVPADEVSGDEVKKLHTKPLDRDHLVYAVKPGDEPQGTWTYHQLVGRTYAPGLEEFARETERVLLNLPLGGLTGTSFVRNMAGRLQDHAVVGVITGDTPTPIVDALEDDELYENARTEREALTTPGNQGKPWTPGEPELVEVNT